MEAAAGVDELDRQGRGLVAGEQELELAGGHQVLDLVGERHREAAAAHGVADRGLGAVGDEAGRDRDAGLPAAAVEAPLGRGRERGEVHERVGVEVGGRARALVAREVGRARDDDAAGGADGADPEARVAEDADADRDVDAFLDEVDQPIREDELDGHRRVLRQEVADERGHLAPAEHVGRGDHEAPGGIGALGPRGALGVVDVGEDPAGSLEVARTRVRERHGPRGPLQEPDRELLLERGDQAGDHRRRDPEAPGGGGEALQLGDGDERRHGGEAVHDHYFCFRNSALSIVPIVATAARTQIWRHGGENHSRPAKELTVSRIPTPSYEASPAASQPLRDAASSDPKATAALRFARAVVAERGHVSAAEVEAVKAAGYTDAQVIEIVLHVALNTLTNYVNTVAGTEIDFPAVTHRTP